MCEPKCEINTPLIHAIGYDFVFKKLAIQVTSGSIYTIDYGYEDYLKFHKSVDKHDTIFMEEIYDLIKDEHSKYPPKLEFMSNSPFKNR